MSRHSKVAAHENGDAVPVAVIDLKKSFGSQNVLNGITLEVPHGQTMAVLGRSGTGKSVLLKLLVGLQHPDRGSIRILGREVAGLSMEELNTLRKEIGFLFQQAALYDSMTVEQNVEFPLRRQSKMPDKEHVDRARELLASVGIEQSDLNKMPSEISGGMQKRVGLARALALNPKIVLLDEPTAGLDPITAAEIGRLIGKLEKERQLTSIVVTHDIHGAKHFSDRVVLLHEGHVILDGTFKDLERSKEPVAMEFLKNAS